jgi:hypothetical protein
MVQLQRIQPVNRLRRFFASRFRDEHGFVIVFVAIGMVMMLAFVALVVDIGNGKQTHRQAQAAADASALAAVEEIASLGADFTGSSTQWASVVQQVKLYSYNNFGMTAASWVGCQDEEHLDFTPDGTANNNTCISASLVAWPNPQPGETTWVNTIRVKTPTKVIQTVFGGSLGVSNLSTQADAEATVTRKRSLVSTTVESSVPGGPCAICVLGDGFSLDGQNGDISVTGGDVVANANPSSGNAAQLMSNGHIKVLGGAGQGGPGAPGKWSGSGYSPPPVYRDAVADPLAAVPACGQTGATCPTNNQSSSGSTLNPGVYSNAISGTHFLNPGVYVLKGGITLSGNAQITGYGVTLYFPCSNYPNPCSALSPSNRNGARIRATGNGAVLLTAPTAAQCTTQPSVCPYQGITIFADRDNTNTFTIRGNGTNENGSATGSSGTIYIKSGVLDLRGNGYTLSSQIITGYITMQGNPSGITVAYDQTKNAPEAHTVTTTTTTEAYSYDATGLEA